MRTLRRPPSRQTLRRASHEPGKPVAALAIIASIFATALVIRILPPAAREALVPMAVFNLPSEPLVIWSASHEPVVSAVVRLPAPIPRARRESPKPAASTTAETTADVPLTFDRYPGDAPVVYPTHAPVLRAARLMPLALPMAVAAEPAEFEAGESPLVSPFTKTGSALRVAFVKTRHFLRITNDK